MKNQDIDKQLRELIRTQLPKEPKDPWFIRKTMNRLPEKHTPVFSRFERMAYIISAVILVALWCHAAVELISNPVLTVSALMQPVLLTIMSLSLIIAVAIPYIKRT